MESENAQIYYTKGYACLMEGDYRAAAICFTKAIELAPDLEHAYIHRSIARQALGEHQLAFDDHIKADNLSPESVKGHIFKPNSEVGLLFFKEHRLSKRSVVMKLAGLMDGYGSVAKAFYDRLQNCYERGSRDFILDCSRLYYMTDMEPARLINFTRHLNKLGGSITLVEIPAKIWSVLQLQGLDNSWDTYETLSDAIDAKKLLQHYK